MGICGEMAANPLMAPLLMGLGIDEFSMSPPAIPLVKAAIRSVRFHEAEELAKVVLSSESAPKVLELCRKLLEKVSPEILELIS